MVTEFGSFEYLVEERKRILQFKCSSRDLI